MDYAIVENGTVINLISLNDSNSREFPLAVRIKQGLHVEIGDTYIDGRFYRNGEEVLTDIEQTQNEILSALVELAAMIAGGE